MPHFGPPELIIILLIVIAIFGAGKLANLGGALGKGVKDFRSAVKDGTEAAKDEEVKPEDKPKAVAASPDAEEKSSEG